jgi:hypothetical protein
MQNRGLLFIPDISGFSRFVSETEIDHSRLIIQELLEILINANDTGLEISEIEGDAILFYKFGEPPTLEELYRQVEKMFCAFHRNLMSYEQHRYCQCKACISANALTLKVITHYGEFTGYNVKTFSKLIGKDLIVAHQLLKNDIPQHEYWLVTDNLMGPEHPGQLTEGMRWGSSVKHTESGEIPFHYIQLGKLKDAIVPEEPANFDQKDNVKMITVAQEYETDIITLFHASGDFNYRSRWQEGVKKVEVVNHFLPRVGMKCRCILEHGELIIYASSYRYGTDTIEFSETDENKSNTTCFTLQRIGPKKTKLTIEFYIKKNLPDQILFRLVNKTKMTDMFRKSLQNLTALVRELKIPSALPQ